MAIDVEEFYRRFGPMVMRRCKSLLRNEDEAMDAMQDVFVNVLKNEKRLTQQAPSSLLYRIATNVCLNKIRARKWHYESEGSVDDILLRIADARDFEEQSLARGVLDRLFQREKESTRTIAVLHYLDGMTFQEVADEVGMSVSGVRKRLRTLKSHVQELEGA